MTEFKGKRTGKRYGGLSLVPYCVDLNKLQPFWTSLFSAIKMQRRVLQIPEILLMLMFCAFKMLSTS